MSRIYRRLEKVCPICDKKFYVYPSQNFRKYCSHKCKAIGYSKRFKGENNPNFGHSWNISLRESQATRARILLENPLHMKAFSRKGKKRSMQARLKHKATLLRLKEQGLFRPHIPTEEEKKIIGIKSSAKFTPEFKQRMKKVRLERGIDRPIEEIPDYEYYRREANWNERMYDYCSKKDLDKLKKFGVFSSINPKGVVRDHMYSRYSGFRDKVFPIILRHPLNCQLLTSSENIKKAKTKHRYEDGDNLTLQELIDNIKSFKKEWHEQSQCLSAIFAYESGKRWTKPNKEGI